MTSGSALILKQAHYWLYITLLLVSINSFSAPFSVNHNLVAFSPEVRLESGGLCQGVRLSGGYIATSQQCARTISNQDSYFSFEVTGLFRKPVGQVFEYSPACDSQGCDMIFSIAENDDVAPAAAMGIYWENKEQVEAYADYLTAEGLLSRTPVNLRFESETDGQKVYSFLQDTELPPGAPVINPEGKLICLVSDNQCSSIPVHLHRAKRSDSENEEGTETAGGTSGVGIYVGIAAGVVGIALLINAGCLSANLIRACARGVPCKQFWTVLLTCTYCTSPHTDYCLLFGWGGVLWSWIGSYNSAPQGHTVFEN